MSSTVLCCCANSFPLYISLVPAGYNIIVGSAFTRTSSTSLLSQSMNMILMFFPL